MSPDTLTNAVEAAQDVADAALTLVKSLDRIDDLARWSMENPTAYAQTLMRLEAVRGLKSHVARWSKAINARAQQIRTEEEPERDPDAPENLARFLRHLGAEDVDDLESPPGYKVGVGGVSQNDAMVTATACVVIGHMTEIESGEVAVELAWLDLGRWGRTIVPRSVITDRNKIGRLADLGLDVSSENAADLVIYLRAFEIHNRARISRLKLSKQCGWVSPHCFLRGHHVHGNPARLEARGGLARIAGGISEAGTLEEWAAFISDDIAPFPSLLLAVYTSMAAPLLHVVKASGFLVDWSGPSGRGKSTALDVACSVWGDPECYRQSWEIASMVGPSEMLAFLNHLPLVMDDTNKVQRGKESIVGQIPYLMEDGLERSRGTRDGGTRVQKTWRTILISSGEQPITSYAGGAVGAMRRTLCLTGPPLGGVSPEKAEMVWRIKNTSRSLYGAAGAAFVDCLCGESRESLKGRHASLMAKYAAMGVGSVDRSLGVGVAVIELASEIARALLPDVDEGQRLAAIAYAWKSAVDSGADSDESKDALSDLIGWLHANAARLYRGTGAAVPSQGYIGSMKTDGQGRWTELSVLPTEARAQLERWNRRSKFCIDEWARRGMMLAGSGGGRTLQRSLGPAGGNPRQYVFTREDLEREGVVDAED